MSEAAGNDMYKMRPPPPWANAAQVNFATELGSLWVAVHDYLVAQAAQAQGDDANGAVLAQAYSALVDEHNRIHAAYIAGNESKPLELAGS